MLTAIHAYELELGRALLSALESIPGLHLYGLTDHDRLEDRVATFSFRLKDLHPRVGAVHYNTLEEVERLKEVLLNIAAEQ